MSQVSDAGEKIAAPACYDARCAALMDACGIDILGVFPCSFVRNFMLGGPDIAGAVRAYIKAVKDGSFPAPAHCS